jgi:hypothetical protein
METGPPERTQSRAERTVLSKVPQSYHNAVSVSSGLGQESVEKASHCHREESFPRRSDLRIAQTAEIATQTALAKTS